MIAGGGTGGHVWAGVAVADAWRVRFGKEAEVQFVGAEGGLEEKLVPRSGYPLTVLRLGSLNRVSLKRRLRTVFQLPLSIMRSFLIVRRMKPDAVLGVGGYASGPLVLAASFFGSKSRKTAILEQNSIPGLTNRWLGKFVDLVFAAFPGTEPRFPGKRVEVCGNPVRAQMRPLAAAKRDLFTIFIFGGSQGAKGVNTLVIDSLPLLADLRGKIRFVHQTGEADFDRVAKAHEAAQFGSRVEKFIYEMEAAYAESSLLICRSGSSTMAEVAAVGRAAVFVPLPTAADNHQETNARVFSDAGAAFLLLQNQSTGADLAKLIRELVTNPSQIDTIETAVKKFYRPNSATDIVASLSASFSKENS
jgi:UDP-N-acetylglucosamine--N-acetylmuramyl-(pentapeptide) pyrophosphoryl-undecaprenol N-acetylglucosamine transferase